MKKALIVATTTNFFVDFELSDINILQNIGYEIHTASNVNINNRPSSYDKLESIGVKQHQIEFSRSPLSLANKKAYTQLKILFQKENYDLVHCHTPVGGVISRLVAKKYKNIKVIYTAHGFHFFKGNNVIKNLVFRAMEKYCAKFTDVLLTINNEDYEAAKDFKLRKNGKLMKINGVGIDTEKFSNISVDKEQKRKELGIDENDIMLLSVGEINANKNHSTVIKALGLMNNPKLHYFIAGVGEESQYLLNLAKELNMADRLHLLRFRKDIIELCKTADIFVFPSFREGLSVALMEAMSSGLPVIASKIRGNVDLIEDGKGGFLVNPYIAIEFKEAIEKYIDNKLLLKEFGEHNSNVIKNYDIKNIAKIMSDIYGDLLGEL